MKFSSDDKFAKGAALHLTAAIEAAEGPQARVENHIFNVRVYAPDGQELRYHAKNLLATGGRASFILPVELNPIGPFKVVVTDVATGVQATHDFAR